MLGADFHDSFLGGQNYFTLALGNSWCMHQLDINNAFLQCKVVEEMFMKQTLGFKHNLHPVITTS